MRLHYLTSDIAYREYQFQFNLKQIYCPTKYRIQHHGCDYVTPITTGKISMHIHTCTNVYTVIYMLNCCPTLNQMLGDIHFRPLEKENGNVIDHDKPLVGQRGLEAPRELMGPATDKLDIIIHKHKRGAQEGGVLNNCIFPLTERVLISLGTHIYMSNGPGHCYCGLPLLQADCQRQRSL